MYKITLMAKENRKVEFQNIWYANDEDEKNKIIEKIKKGSIEPDEVEDIEILDTSDTVFDVDKIEVEEIEKETLKPVVWIVSWMVSHSVAINENSTRIAVCQTEKEALERYKEWKEEASKYIIFDAGDYYDVIKMSCSRFGEEVIVGS